MDQVWHYVFISATGKVSLGCQLLGREPAYQSRDMRAARRFARRAMSSRGGTWREGTPSVNARGKQILIPSAAFYA